MLKAKKKQMSIDDLAVMVAKDFQDTQGAISDLDKKVDRVEKDLKLEISGLRNSVNNYLKLTDKRYLELKSNQQVLAKYIKLVIEKAKVTVDLKELEMILK